MPVYRDQHECEFVSVTLITIHCDATYNVMRPL